MRKMPKWLVLSIIVIPVIAAAFKLHHQDEASRVTIVIYIGFLLTMLRSGYTRNTNDDAN